MPGIDIYGIFMPVLLPLALVAAVVAGVIRGLLSRAGLYRFVWHPALVDVALFIIILGAVTALYSTTDILNPIFS